MFGAAEWFATFFSVDILPSMGTGQSVIRQIQPMILWYVFSPPVRWGLLDFMWALSSSSSSSSSVFCVGSQPRSCEFSVPCRTSIAILWGQCSAPDLNRKNVKRYVRKNVRKNVRQNVRKNVRKNVRQNVRRNVRQNVRKNVERYVRKNVKRYVRQNVGRYDRKNVRRYVRKNVRRYAGLN